MSSPKCQISISITLNEYADYELIKKEMDIKHKEVYLTGLRTLKKQLDTLLTK